MSGPWTSSTHKELPSLHAPPQQQVHKCWSTLSALADNYAITTAENLGTSHAAALVCVPAVCSVFVSLCCSAVS